MKKKIEKSDEQWREELAPEVYRVTREKGTELAFTGRYWASKEAGLYLCAACGWELFKSEDKYDSGSGWPSFSAPAERASVEEKLDQSHGMIRTEIICGRCDSHLGHVFPDGPPETGFALLHQFRRARFPEAEVRIAVLPWVLLLPAVAWAQQPEHRLNLGAYFAEGRFNGHSDTVIRYLPIGYQWRGERWGFQLLAAGLSITGVGNVLVNIGEVTRVVAGSQVTTETGFGDTIAGVSYAPVPFADWAPFVDLRLDVKLPTADEQRSLGTGRV